MAAVANLAKTSDVEVMIITAIHPCGSDGSHHDAQLVEAQMRATAGRVLDDASRFFEINGIRVSGKIICGDPVSSVIALEAEAGSYDVIAMASRGMSLKKDGPDYVGSVTQDVIQRVRVPVLVIPLTTEG